MFVTAMVALTLSLFFACCCSSKGCTPRHWKKQRAEHRLSNEVAELTRRLEESKKDMEARLEAKLEEGEGEGVWLSMGATIPRPKSPSAPTLGAPR